MTRRAPSKPSLAAKTYRMERVTWRCRIKAHWLHAGHEGDYFGRIFVRDTWWGIVRMDDCDDPDLMKFQSLEFPDGSPKKRSPRWQKRDILRRREFVLRNSVIAAALEVLRNSNCTHIEETMCEALNKAVTVALDKDTGP